MHRDARSKVHNPKVSPHGKGGVSLIGGLKGGGQEAVHLPNLNHVVGSPSHLQPHPTGLLGEVHQPTLSQEDLSLDEEGGEEVGENRLICPGFQGRESSNCGEMVVE